MILIILLGALGMGFLRVANAQSIYTTPYTFTTLAGSGVQPYGSVDGIGASASFYNPTGVAVDASGNAYVADVFNHKIRKISPAGVVSTLAGSGNQGSLDGTGAAASFYRPGGVAVDAAGNVFVSDTNNNVIRKITPAGVVTTLAGSGGYGSADGSAAAATFSRPEGVAVDAGGNLYIADTGSNKIRVVTPAGAVSTLAGSGVGGTTNGTGTAARFHEPKGVAVDGSGNVFVVDYYGNKVRKVTSAGLVTTVAGTGSSGSLDGSAASATFYYPHGVAVDAGGNLYIAESQNRKIRMITPAGIVSTLAGSGNYGSADGIGAAAYFASPSGVAIDPGGNILVADSGNNRIRKVTPTGATSIFAGSDMARDETGTAASFYNPDGVAVDASGNLYVADTSNHKIRKISPAGVVSTFAGSGAQGSADGNGAAASFSSPTGVAVDASGNVFVADSSNSKIRKITPAGDVTTFAGSGLGGSANGTGTAASFNQPGGLAVDASGNLYVADRGNHKIRKISPAGVVTTLAGSGNQGSVNGTGAAASFDNPRGVTVDTAGNVFVADFANNKIRKITPAGLVSTFAGSGSQGSADGTGVTASFIWPTDVAADSSGNVFVADYGNHKIRKITPTGMVSTAAGSGSYASVDGNGAAASFYSPSGVAVDGNGRVFVTDEGSHKIRKGTPGLLTQTITFGPLPTKSVAAAPFAITASVGSGLPVTLSIFSGPATITGNIVTLTGPGTVVVRATQAGNSSFEPAPAVYQSFIVTVETDTTFHGYLFQTLAGSGYLSTFGSTDGSGGAASFSIPTGVAADSNGNVFVADRDNNKIRKVTPAGVVTTFAGSGIEGNMEGTGTAARFYRPSGVAVDASGNVFVADTFNNKIRKITAAGVVTTFAGSGSSGSANGTGSAASFNSPTGVAVDAGGNVFVADLGNHRIRKITAAGAVTTHAGSGVSGSANGTGTAASFNSPQGVAVDQGGSVFVADQGNHKIRKITAAGVVSNFAGSGTGGNTDGTGTSASFLSPQGVVVDASGNVFVADVYNSRIRKITSAGVVTTFAGSGSQGGGDGTGMASSFNSPTGVAVDASGNVFVADSVNNRIRKITPAGVVSSLAGRSLSADGTGTAASFNGPYGATVDAGGNIFVADSSNNKIRKITPAGVVSTVAGSGSEGSADGPAMEASFRYPQDVAMDTGGNIFVADSWNNKIRKITPAGVVSTFAGSGVGGSLDGIGAEARFNQPNGVAVDASGNVFVADSSNSKIRMISPSGVVTTFAGSGVYGSLDGNSNEASFRLPRGIALDADGNVFVADSAANNIRKITPAGVVSTLAGSGNQGSADGTGRAASFYGPSGVAVDTSGNVFVTDYRNHLIRKITQLGEVTTIAGSMTSGSNDGFGTAARFYLPSDITVDPSGNLYVADLGNKIIRKGVPFSGTSISQTIAFSPLAGKVFGDSSFGINATATSGLPVSFSIVSGPATVSGTTITLTGAGTVRVRASQSGSDIFTAAPTVDQSFLVTGGTIPNLAVVSFSSMAGSGIRFFGSADGIGTEASFASPSGVAVDASGNVYIADYNNNKIRKMTAAGVVTTLAGSGLAGSTDGIGSAASFNQPYGVAVDAGGNVYVADRLNYKIRMISPAGEVSTLAGSGVAGSTNGTGVAASFNLPTAVAVDSSGNVFVADSRNHKIRKITPAGVVTTFAGSGAAGGANGTGTAASFNETIGVAVDTTGNLYVTDYYNRKIRKITPAGVVTTLAGSGAQGSSDGPGSLASFMGLGGVAVDATGNVFVADSLDNKIRKITPTGVVTTFAGSGLAGSADGTGTSVNFNSPVGVAVDASGNVFVADTGNHKIRKITPAAVVTTVAGANTSQDGSGTAANFNNPLGVAVDSSRNVFVADTGNHKIRKITPAGVVTAFAGSGLVGSTDGNGASASFSNPKGIAVDSGGNVFVADAGNHKIRKITPAGVVTTLAGSGVGGITNGTGAAASFNSPSGVALDLSGNVFVGDTYNNRIRKITPAGAVTTFAGSGFNGSSDGTGATASFSFPEGVTVDANGNVFVADTSNGKIRKISPTGVVTTFAGSGSGGSVDGTGTAASFNGPTGVAVDSSGSVFVADRGNHKIRKITPAGVVNSLAGSVPYGALDGIGTEASFNLPHSVAVDASGNLFIADTGNNRIRKGVHGLTQVITFNPLPDKIAGDAAFGLIATSTSGLPVTFSILSGPATLSGAIITLTGPGTVVVRASQAGDASYVAASAADQSFIVTTVNNPMIPLSTWATAVGLIGEDAAPDATPFNDGVPNLLKYAFNMNASGPDVSVLTPVGSSGLPQVLLDESGEEPVLKVEFLRRKGSGLVYTPERATSLDAFTAMTGAQTVTPINSEWERVSVIETNPPTSASSGFARVRVTIP